MLAIGASGEASFTVQFGDTARGLSRSVKDDFPEVLASSRMIALMELAAARLMKPMLGPGQVSVGIGMDVRHDAATPVGSVVRAVALYQGKFERVHRFDVEAFDEAGSIGEGVHTRAIVVTERLLASAERRKR
jgi:predicted thioesterase